METVGVALISCFDALEGLDGISCFVVNSQPKLTPTLFNQFIKYQYIEYFCCQALSFEIFFGKMT
jgi:hypothetical protein